MTGKERNDLFYLCVLVEFIARKTNNRPADVVSKIGKDELCTLYEYADVNHCLSLDQVSDETIERSGIKQGTYRSSPTEHEVPSVNSIGREYRRLIEAENKSGESLVETFVKIFTSFISDAISDYDSAFYYSGSAYIKACYENGKLLA